MSTHSGSRVAVVNPLAGGWEVRVGDTLMGVFPVGRGDRLDYDDAKGLAVGTANLLHILGRVDRVEVRPLPTIGEFVPETRPLLAARN